MAENGRVAVVEYVGRIAEGEAAGAVFDTTDADLARAEGIRDDDRDYEPLASPVGEGIVIDGTEAAVADMAAGETRTTRVPPEAAFGRRDGERVSGVPWTELEAEFDFEAAGNEPTRSETSETGRTTEATEEEIEIDFNHEPVVFELRVLDVREENGGKDGADETST
jgi:FKBP-type peptidyl-prolyl cis-trans isomerase 2